MSTLMPPSSSRPVRKRPSRSSSKPGTSEKGFDLALDRHVQVLSVPDPEQQIANGAAHQICRDPLGDAAQHVDSGEVVHQLGQPSRVDFT